jgi:hypothetical protein
MRLLRTVPLSAQAPDAEGRAQFRGSSGKNYRILAFRREPGEPFRSKPRLEGVDLEHALALVSNISDLKIEILTDIDEDVTIALRNVTTAEALDAILEPLVSRPI